ncbi:glycosyltransferase [Streptomyces sp. GTA36]
MWVGRIEPAKDLISLLHAFAEIRKDEPKTRLRIVGAPAEGLEGATYLAHCKALAAQLFPDEADGVHTVGDNPVSFEEIGGPEVPTLPEAYEAGAVVVLSSVVEGFPISLVEAMFCGRATVSTDVGAVVEVIGGTGLVVPPRNPRALAEACVSLLRDPERRARLRRGGTRAGARTVHRRAEHHGISRHLPGDHRALSGPAGPRRRLGRTPAVRHTGRDPCTGAVGRLRHPTGRGQTRAGMGRGTTGPGCPTRVRL